MISVVFCSIKTISNIPIQSTENKLGQAKRILLVLYKKAVHTVGVGDKSISVQCLSSMFAQFTYIVRGNFHYY